MTIGMHAEPDEYWADKERRRPLVLLVAAAVIALAGVAAVVAALLPERGHSATGRLEAVLPQRVHGLFYDAETEQLLQPDQVPARVAKRSAPPAPAPARVDGAGAAEWVVSWRRGGVRNVDVVLRRDDPPAVGSAVPLRVSTAGTVLRLADQGRSRVGLAGGVLALVVAALLARASRRAAAWSRWRRQLEQD